LDAAELTQLRFVYVCIHRIITSMHIKTRWLYCVECPQYSIRLEALGYMCASCLLPAFDTA